MSACPYGCDGSGTLYVRPIEKIRHLRGGYDMFVPAPTGEMAVPCDCRIVKRILSAMNTIIGDAMGKGYCVGCGDALVWNYELAAGHCYRCQS